VFIQSINAVVDLLVSNCDTNRFVFNVDHFGSCAWSLFVSFARHLCV
jgi:hypothetical protein